MSVALPEALILILQALVLASAAAASVATGHRTLALVFGVIVVVAVISVALMYMWGQ